MTALFSSEPAHRADGNFAAAVELYTKGIEVFPMSSLFNNRAMSQLRMENWGSVIEDTNSALELDPTNAKACYRQGCAYIGLGKLKEAAGAFKKVMLVCSNYSTVMRLDQAVELEPKDRLARDKLKVFTITCRCPLVIEASAAGVQEGTEKASFR